MRLVGVAVLALWASGAGAGADDRSCMVGEREGGNEQLTAIAGDSDRGDELIRAHLPFGRHESRHAAEGGPENEELLVQAGYVTLHDGDLRTALWTAHKLTRDDVLGGDCKPRVHCFREDERLTRKRRAEEDDYDDSEYDRGHLAPDRDLRDDTTEQVNSYVMSNMSPQHGSFNRGIWKRLENLGRSWAKAYGTVYVTSGAIFDFDSEKGRDRDDRLGMVPRGRVAIPSHFYKVFVRRNEDGDRWSAISFLLEHEDKASDGKARERLEDAIKPIETIEEHAEATFHPALDRNHIEVNVDWNGWGYLPIHRAEKAVCERKRADEGEGSSGGVENAGVDDILARYDDDGNGRISCKEARRHGIAPVHRSHPAYQYMRDGDGDGVVCE